MPRTDLASLGITYRRIPVLAINGEVFCDTALIIRELERRFPEGKLGDDEGEWEKWEEWSNGIFPDAAKLISTDLPLMKDKRFVKDREEYSGRVGGSLEWR
jgi:glutathione S-transferase